MRAGNGSPLRQATATSAQRSANGGAWNEGRLAGLLSGGSFRLRLPAAPFTPACTPASLAGRRQ